MVPDTQLIRELNVLVESFASQGQKLSASVCRDAAERLERQVIIDESHGRETAPENLGKDIASLARDFAGDDNMRNIIGNSYYHEGVSYAAENIACMIEDAFSADDAGTIASVQATKEKIRACFEGLSRIKATLRPSAYPDWRDVSSAPKEKRVLVVSKRFPEPHEAMLYSNGWHTWGVSGAFKDDPYLWTDLPPAPQASIYRLDA